MLENVLGGVYFELTSHAACQGKYLGINGFRTKADAAEACKKDNICAGVTGSITLQQNNPDCEIHVQMFYLCKYMVKIDPANEPSECFWKKTFGGLIDNSYYGKNF